MFISLIIGFFLSYFFLTEYKDFKGIKVASEADEYYFLQYGIYNSKEELEKDSIGLLNYVYRKEDGKYYMYIGITKSKESEKKKKNYYKDKGIDVLLWNYRGYGFSKGRSSFKKTKNDVLKVFDSGITKHHYNMIAVGGYSIGGVAATHLAVNRRIDVLISDRNFASISKKHESLLILSRLIKLLF